MMVNPTLTPEERRLYVERTQEHQKQVKQAQGRYEKRIRLHKITTKQEFVDAVRSSRIEDRRMPLVLSSKVYDRRLHVELLSRRPKS